MPKVMSLEQVTEERTTATADPYKPQLAGNVALLEQSIRQNQYLDRVFNREWHSSSPQGRHTSTASNHG